MFVVFDTNVWLSELALRSSVGSAVRSHILKSSATVAVPEVVRREVSYHMLAKLTAASKDIQKAHRELLAIFGSLPEIFVPNSNQIKVKANNLIAELDVPIRDIPFTLESAKASFAKIIEKAPPSDGSQQFKDGVIWADCMCLAHEADVYLVTEDKAFYGDRKYEHGLAANLQAEAEACPFEIRILSNLLDLLPQIRTPIELDENELAREILAHRTFAADPVERVGFLVEQPPSFTFKPHHTEAAQNLLVEFEVSFRCSDITSQSRPDGHLTCTGTCTYDLTTNKASGMRLDQCTFQYRGDEGDALSTSVAVGGATLSAGLQTTHHFIKRPVE